MKVSLLFLIEILQANYLSFLESNHKVPEHSTTEVAGLLLTLTEMLAVHVHYVL